MNGGRIGDLDQSNSQLSSSEIMPKSIEAETKANKLQGEIVLKKVGSLRDETTLSSFPCNGGEMAFADVAKGVDFSKVCERAISVPASADRVKNSLVKRLGNSERGLDFKGHTINGVIGSVHGSIVSKTNGKIWSNPARIHCNGETFGVLQQGILASSGKVSANAVANWVDGIRGNCANAKVACTVQVQGIEAFANVHNNGTTERGFEVVDQAMFLSEPFVPYLQCM